MKVIICKLIVIILIGIINAPNASGQTSLDNLIVRTARQFDNKIQNQLNSINARIIAGAPQNELNALKKEFKSDFFYHNVIIQDFLNDSRGQVDFYSFYKDITSQVSFVNLSKTQNPTYCIIDDVQLVKFPFTINDQMVIISFITLGSKKNLELKIYSIHDLEGGKDCINAINIKPTIYQDSDGDTVIDSWDKCPNTEPGVTVTSDGCPAGEPPVYDDQDNDGVLDDNDKCPNTPLNTSVDSNGCPIQVRDEDQDGVIDEKDECPGTPKGVRVDSKGCPTSTKDSDGDGIPDNIDLCPDTPKGPIMCYNHWKKRNVVRITSYGCIDCDLDGKSPDKPSDSFFYDEDDNDWCITNNFCGEREPDVLPCDSLKIISVKDSLRHVIDSVTIVRLRNDSLSLESKLNCYNQQLSLFSKKEKIDTILIDYFKEIAKIGEKMRESNKDTSIINKTYGDRMRKMYKEITVHSNIPVRIQCNDIDITLSKDRLSLTQNLLAARMIVKNWANVKDDSLANQATRGEFITFVLNNLSSALTKNPNYNQKQEIQMLMFDLNTTSQMQKVADAAEGRSVVEISIKAILDNNKKEDHHGVLKEYVRVKDLWNNNDIKTEDYTKLSCEYIVAKLLLYDKGDISKLKSFFPTGSVLSELLTNRVSDGKTLLNKVINFENSNKDARIDKLIDDAIKFKTIYINK